MKTIYTLLIAIFCAELANAEFRKWTNNENQKADLELLSVKDVSGEKVGDFKMRNGRTIQIKASDLIAADAELLNAWQPPVVEIPSVFDDVLDNNLVKLEGKSLKSFKDLQKPQKYFLFYYTASWCPPCRAFTPKLVEWYNTNKNDNFELVLITCDRDEANMEAYARDKKMPWPQLELNKVKSFRSKFQHGVRGIPSLIVCDLKGDMLGNYRSKLTELTTMVAD